MRLLSLLKKVLGLPTSHAVINPIPLDKQQHEFYVVHELLPRLLKLTNQDGRLNANALLDVARNIEASNLTVKFFGYELARQLAAALPVRTETQAQSVALACKATTQSDMESDWLAHWCAELKIPVVFHRKVWELAYVLQTLHDCGMLEPGRRGLGFGCGEEAIPSYLASRGVDVTATDQTAERAVASGWAGANQHLNLDVAFKSHLVSREAFDRHVSFAVADMNAIPETLRDYDFCWSICAFEHLGSIAKGLAFVENVLATLRPGGVSVHTTEYNFLNDQETMDHCDSVLFQRRHFQEIHDRLTALGHKVAPLNFSVGSKPLDRFIDLPPFAHDWSQFMRDEWAQETPHLKVNAFGFAATCFGLIVVKGPE